MMCLLNKTSNTPAHRSRFGHELPADDDDDDDHTHYLHFFDPLKLAIPFMFIFTLRLTQNTPQKNQNRMATEDEMSGRGVREETKRGKQAAVEELERKKNMKHSLLSMNDAHNYIANIMMKQREPQSVLRAHACARSYHIKARITIMCRYISIVPSFMAICVLRYFVIFELPIIVNGMEFNNFKSASKPFTYRDGRSFVSPVVSFGTLP